MVFLFLGCSSESEDTTSTNELARQSNLPAKVLKLRNNSALKMIFTLVVSADENHDYSNLQNDFYLTQEIILDAYQSADLVDFTSTNAQGVSQSGQFWKLFQNGNFVTDIPDIDTNIAFGTYFNGNNNNDGYYCQWKYMKGNILGTYQSLDLNGSNAYFFSPFFEGVTQLNSIVNYQENGNPSPYFSVSEIVIGGTNDDEIKVILEDVQQ